MSEICQYVDPLTEVKSGKMTTDPKKKTKAQTMVTFDHALLVLFSFVLLSISQLTVARRYCLSGRYGKDRAPLAAFGSRDVLAGRMDPGISC